VELTNEGLFEQYQMIKNNLIVEIYNIKDWLSKNYYGNDFRELKKNIGVTIDRLNKDMFTVSVIGEVKKGKSTLMNALMKSKYELCPVDALEKTAVLTILSYGGQERATARNFSDKFINITLDEIDEYVSKDGRYTEDTLSVKVYLNNKFLKNKVLLVDTPGVNTTSSARQKITQDYLSKSDAVIFLVTADELISHSEKEFLIKKVYQENGIESILVVMNKVDYQLDEDELREQIDYVNNIIRSFTGFEIDELIPVSAKKALKAAKTNDAKLYRESGFENLEMSLEQFLIKVRGRAKLVKHSNLIKQNIIEKVEFGLFTYLNNLDDSFEELEEKIKKLEQEKSLINAKTKDTQLKVSNLKQDVIKGLILELNLASDLLFNKIAETFKNTVTEYMVKTLEGNIKDQLSRNLIQIKAVTIKNIENGITELLREERENLSAFLRTIDSRIKVESNIFISFDNAKEIKNEEVGFIQQAIDWVTKIWTGNTANHKKVIFHKEQIEKTVKDKMLYIRNDLTRSIENTTGDIANTISRNTNSLIDNLLKQINAIKDEKLKKTSEIESRKSKLKTQIKELSEIKDRFSVIVNKAQQL
jgi:hypothetical protein